MKEIFIDYAKISIYSFSLFGWGAVTHRCGAARPLASPPGHSNWLHPCFMLLKKCQLLIFKTFIDVSVFQ